MRVLLLVFSSLLLAGSAHAQLGFRAGATVATVAANPSRYQKASSDAKAGYQLGLFYEHKLNSRFSVMPELQFSRQRTELFLQDNSVDDGGYASNYRLSQSYLHVPVLLRARLGSFYAEAGPQASLQVASHDKGTEEMGSIAGPYGPYSINRPATDRYRRFDVGLCAGLGVQLPAGFGLSVRGTVGLRPMLAEVQPGPYFPVDLRSRVLQAAISYQLPGGA